ncbi:hypothetical protein ACPPVO_37705 [Dactylosporangium sp. McL0621]|uniref:hypothetical protein n=1 Tax=Dactylosporangium sp. McL0621 TaxID=3415678 RepID=UPI003CE892ED
MERVLGVTQVLLELLAKPGKARTARLTITDEGVDVNGDGFRWGEITRIQYRAIDQHVNGAYMHTSFTLGVGDARHAATFMMFSGTTGALKTKVDHATRTAFHERWARAADLLEHRAGVRLAADAVAAVHGGDAAEMAGLRLDGAGVHKGGLFRRSIAWAEYAGVRREPMYLHLLARRGDKAKSRIQVHNGAWNVTVLPRVLAALTPGGGK